MGRIFDYMIFAERNIREMVCNLLNLRRKYNGNEDVTDKVVVITGANTGIGKVTAIEMAKRNANVIIGCRDIDKGNNAIEEIKNECPNANIRLIKLDLSSLQSVRQFAKRINDEEKKIDILINNAGIGWIPKWKTEDGFEMTFGTNHLGHFLLTLQLLDRIKAAPKARIVIVSSNLHLIGKIDFDDINLDNDYSPAKAYTQSKLANVLFAKELAHRLSETNISVYSLHPGFINSEFSRHVRFASSFIGRAFYRLFATSPDLGAQTTLYCALDQSIANQSGDYYSNCQRFKRMTSNVNVADARKLWNLSCDLVGLEDRLRLD